MPQSPEPTQDQFFHRPVLAIALADQALDTSLGTSGGMFLAAPRRTGKSTFVRQDLMPEFERRNLNVIYVDLWIDKTVNPAIHIANAIRIELARQAGHVGQWARAGVLWRRHGAVSHPRQRLCSMVGGPLQTQSGHRLGD